MTKKLNERDLRKKIKMIYIVIFGLVIASGIIYFLSINKNSTNNEMDSLDKNSKNKMKTNTDKLLLLPYPKKVEWSNGMFKLPTPFIFSSITADIKIIKRICKNRLKTEAVANSNSTIKFLFHKDIKSQSYRLIINPNQMTIEYGDEVGLFYALTTVKQLADKRDNRLPCGLIEDSPDLKTRGAMLDISRGKVPTLETLYKVVDLLSDLKYNHLQLYIEGF